MNGLRLIAVFRLLKGALLLAVGIGALSLLHRDVAVVVEGWVNSLRVDPDNHFIHGLLLKLSLFDDTKLKQLSAGTFIYATLLLIEGVGLWLQKRWAEYLTVIATSLFIPLEIYELVERVTFTRLAILIINAAIVVYLIYNLRTEKK